MINKRVADFSVESSEEVSSEEPEASSEVAEKAKQNRNQRLLESPSSSTVPSGRNACWNSRRTRNNKQGAYNNSYTIKAGNNLYRIAVNHKYDVDELMQANGLSSTEAQIGMVLNVK